MRAAPVAGRGREPGAPTPEPPSPRPARVGLRRGVGAASSPGHAAERSGRRERAVGGKGGGSESFGAWVPLLESLRAAKAEGGTETKFPLSPRQAQV